MRLQVSQKIDGTYLFFMLENKPYLSDQNPLCNSSEFLKFPGGLIEKQILVPER